MAAVFNPISLAPLPYRLLGRTVAFSQYTRAFIARLDRRAHLWGRRRLVMQSDLHRSLHPEQPQEQTVP